MLEVLRVMWSIFRILRTLICISQTHLFSKELTVNIYFEITDRKQEKWITDFKMTTCPAPEITCQGERTSRMYMPCRSRLPPLVSYKLLFVQSISLTTRYKLFKHSLHILTNMREEVRLFLRCCISIMIRGWRWGRGF